MRDHILLEKAFRYTEPLEVPIPADCIFNEERGYWVNSQTNEVMMLMKERPIPQSKKCDRETGEDQKGE